MNLEGMEDRYYFDDWGGCTCPEGSLPDPDCPLFDGDEPEEEDEDE